MSQFSKVRGVKRGRDSLSRYFPFGLSLKPIQARSVATITRWAPGNTNSSRLLLEYVSAVDARRLSRCHLTSCHLPRCQLSRGHLVRRPFSLRLVITFFLPHSVQRRIGKGGVATKELWDAQVAVPLAPTLLSRWPIPRLLNWVAPVNEPLSEQELEAVRRCLRRGRPLGDASWVKTTARRLGLESTLRPRSRRRVRAVQKTQNDESCPLFFS